MNRAEKRRAHKQGKSTDPLAITWFSNAVWANTGYGTQSRQAIPRIQADGHAVAVATNWGLHETQLVYEGIPHYPMGVDAYSNDSVGPVFRDWTRQNPGGTPLAIALFDAWPLRGVAWDKIPVGIWTMVDHLPVPPAVLAFLAKDNVLPLAASQFAHRQILEAGVDALYVPMAIDTDVYKPTQTWRNDGQQLTGRQLMGFDDDVFVVSCINANKSGNGVHRKAWGENLMAFSIFAERHDDVRLYIHSERHGKYGGVDFDVLLNALGIPQDKYRFVSQWATMIGAIPNEAMAAIHTATDVLLAATYGEGFGLTVAEAGACETPAIVSSFTCQPELVSDDSFVVGGQLWWNSLQSAWWQIPSVVAIVDALEAAYARGRFRSSAQREHVVANYDADTVFEEHWRPALERLAEHSREWLSPKVLPSAPVPQADPLLTIYVPTFQRPDELRSLLNALVPQLTPEVELIISDDDPESTVAQFMPAGVEYVKRGVNLGGDENLQRGYESGRGAWVWMIGDDDVVLPGSVRRILNRVDSTDADRLILRTPSSPEFPDYSLTGAPSDIEASCPGITIASTLITSNVVRRKALDLAAGRERVDTMYGWAYSLAGIRDVCVLPVPAFDVGTSHTGEYVASRGKSEAEVVDIWRDLLAVMGVPWSDSALAWNFVTAAKAA